MWEALTIQTLMFFLFFQPRLLALRRIRYVLLAFCLTLSLFMNTYVEMDPFAWLLFAIAIVLTYWTANKALRWVFSNKEFVQRESRRYTREETRVQELIAKKEADTSSLQSEIHHVSDMYDNVKDMSAALEQLDLFVTLAESITKNFPINKIRLLLLKDGPEKQKIIDRVYQVDPTRSEFRFTGKNLMSKDVMFQGQAFPADLKVVEALAAQPQSIFMRDKPDDAATADSLIALPISDTTGLSAVLAMEGVRRSDTQSMSILTDRFASEYRRIRLYEDVQRLATTDGLTGLYVRRYFFKRLEEEISRCQRFNLKFSFLMIDIDDFKNFNDKYGHLVGDALLKQTAAVIKQNVREVDLVARYGGEEFAAILLDTDAEGAMFVGQRIRKNIERAPFKVYDEEIPLTVSIGVATYSEKINEGSEIVEWADSALYQSKRQGKNRVCAFVN